VLAAGLATLDSGRGRRAAPLAEIVGDLLNNVITSYRCGQAGDDGDLIARR
jgi:hypothetical protein